MKIEKEKKLIFYHLSWINLTILYQLVLEYLMSQTSQFVELAAVDEKTRVTSTDNFLHNQDINVDKMCLDRTMMAVKLWQGKIIAFNKFEGYKKSLFLNLRN